MEPCQLKLAHSDLQYPPAHVIHAIIHAYVYYFFVKFSKKTNRISVLYIVHVQGAHIHHGNTSRHKGLDFLCLAFACSQKSLTCHGLDMQGTCNGW